MYIVSEDQSLKPFQTSHLRNCLLRNLTDVCVYVLCPSLLVVETQVLSVRLILEIAIKIAVFLLGLVIKNIILR